MKKLSFIEALIVNEHKKVYRLDNQKYVPYEIYELKNSGFSVRSMSETDFYSEPEKIEFECELFKSSSYTWPMVRMYTLSGEQMDNLLNKKIKVTVEVIE